mmetsp:Transcript_7332/g.11142  ORF Transcript_7332/g.11142 Transcript_7332/m.11142 type:complete len:131 (+) Transcript_7332:875-1267(+)
MFVPGRNIWVYITIILFFSNLGRIPKSRWATWGPSTYVGGDFWEGRLGNMKSLKEIEKTWAKHGIVKPKNVNERVIFYCGSGWRSSLAWVLAKLMGWSHVSNYDGGWLEWSTTHPRASSHGNGIERAKTF